ncbi:MAG: DNA polymerase III subunit beta [Gemmatimonadota bacterium]
MKFSITREALQSGLGAVASAIPTRTTLPVLSNILMRADDGVVHLSGTDLDISVSLSVPAEVSEGGAVTVPAKKLVEIARVLDDAPVKISTDGAQVSLECGKSRFKLYGLAEDEFPSFPEVDFDQAWRMKASDVQELIHRTSFAVSSEESRPILNGVLWQLGPSTTVMVATNGHRLAKMTKSIEGAGAPETDLIIPPKALSQVEKLYSADDDLEIARSDNHLGFRSADRVVFTRLIEGPYPNYDQVIPKDNDKNAIANRGALEASIKRMAVVASDQTHRVRLGFEKGALRFRVQTPDLGEAEDELTLDYDGDAIEIGFNATYLLEILRYMPDEDVKITFKAPERAATFSPASGDPDYLCLVMPLRLLD